MISRVGEDVKLPKQCIASKTINCLNQFLFSNYTFGKMVSMKAKCVQNHSRIRILIPVRNRWLQLHVPTASYYSIHLTLLYLFIFFLVFPPRQPDISTARSVFSCLYSERRGQVWHTIDI